MDKKNSSRTSLGMFFQVFGLIFFIGGLAKGDGALFLIGLLFFLPGLVIYWNEESTLLTYARDWVITLFIISLLMDVISFMVLITGAESFLTALGALAILAAVTVCLWKLLAFINKKYK